MDLTTYKAKPNKTIREHTDDLLARALELRQLNYIKDGKTHNLLKIACEYHDYGKVNQEFQNRIRNNKRFNEDLEIAHNILSLYFLDKNLFEETEDYYKVAYAVLNHHHYCKNFEIIEDPQYKELSQELLADFKTYPITRRASKNISAVAEDEETILIKGLLHRCDYSASADNVIEYQNDFLTNGLELLLGSWKMKCDNAKWNELQQFCIDNRDHNIMVTAQTGMGKTEAGLHWIGNNKGFFILPLKSAINAIYSRIKSGIIHNKKVDERLGLLHSDALSYYIRDKDKEVEMDILTYHKQSKQFSMPLTVSTIDQLFDFVFKYPGYELKLATLSYSKIVIDEIQMYGSDILAYLIYGIKKINKMGGSIAILTATLAPFIKELLTTGDDPVEFIESTYTSNIKRHNIKTFDSKIESAIVYKKYMENTSGGNNKKILVICNTVKKAQQIYQELKDCHIENINILHSKFIKCDRSEKEEEILKFGETNFEGDGIWIATQVVEASLDIDFDYLFTELSDISSLFQRLGRCNRKGIKSIEHANCFVFLEIEENLLTNGNRGFIDRKIYEISKEAIENENIEGFLSEERKVEIINKYLTTERLAGSDYIIKYHDFYNYLDGLFLYEVDMKDINFRNIISYDVIPEVIYQKNQEEIDAKSKILTYANVAPLEKVELREDIRKYTVPVGRYDIYSNKAKLIVKNIKLSNYEYIYVLKCQYDELGFTRWKGKDEDCKSSFENRFW